MTLQQYPWRLAGTIHGKLIAEPRPTPQPPSPSVRLYLDAWTALVVWHKAIQHVHELRGDESPVVDPDLDIATALLRHEGQTFGLEDDQWIVVARCVASRPIPIQLPVRLLIARESYR